MTRLLLLPFALFGVLLLTIAAFGVAANHPLPALVFLGGGAVALAIAQSRRGEPKAPATLETPEAAPETRGTLEQRGFMPAFLVRLLGRRPRAEQGAEVPIMVPLGTTENGEQWFDVAKSPHVLIGGATGSGKSVFLNTLIATATAQHTPKTLGVVLIDPKRVELARFRNLPHVLGYADEKPQALALLERVVNTMDARYRRMEGEQRIIDHRILVVLDEFADLTLPLSRDKAERDLSDNIAAVLARLLALGRAAGIHVVFATQRPDRRVVDGLIKANAPTRIAFAVANSVESRIILDSAGAEALPGKGAGLVASPLIPNPKTPGKPVRFQGLLVPDDVLRKYVLAASSGL